MSFTSALCVLESFITKELKNKFQNNEEKLTYELNKLNNGIKLPMAQHGDYRENWANELYHMKKEGNYNILAIAHQLFLIEYIAIQ